MAKKNGNSADDQKGGAEEPKTAKAVAATSK